MIQLKTKHITKINDHACQVYPEECCGLLLGTINHHEKIVIKVIPTQNSWESEAELFKSSLNNPPQTQKEGKFNRFCISSQDMLWAIKEARKNNLVIIGVYHSHPDYPSVPSEFDQAIAWAEYSYLIVSVVKGKAQDLLSWEINQEGKFQREPMIIIT